MVEVQEGLLDEGSSPLAFASIFLQTIQAIEMSKIRQLRVISVGIRMPGGSSDCGEWVLDVMELELGVVLDDVVIV
jgi:hypothetical protein